MDMDIDNGTEVGTEAAGLTTSTPSTGTRPSRSNGMVNVGVKNGTGEEMHSSKKMKREADEEYNDDTIGGSKRAHTDFGSFESIGGTTGSQISPPGHDASLENWYKYEGRLDLAHLRELEDEDTKLAHLQTTMTVTHEQEMQQLKIEHKRALEDKQMKHDENMKSKIAASKRRKETLPVTNAHLQEEVLDAVQTLQDTSNGTVDIPGTPREGRDRLSVSGSLAILSKNSPASQEHDVSPEVHPSRHEVVTNTGPHSDLDENMFDIVDASRRVMGGQDASALPEGTSASKGFANATTDNSIARTNVFGEIPTPASTAGAAQLDEETSVGSILIGPGSTGKKRTSRSAKTNKASKNARKSMQAASPTESVISPSTTQGEPSNTPRSSAMSSASKSQGSGPRPKMMRAPPFTPQDEPSNPARPSFEASGSASQAPESTPKKDVASSWKQEMSVAKNTVASSSKQGAFSTSTPSITAPLTQVEGLQANPDLPHIPFHQLPKAVQDGAKVIIAANPKTWSEDVNQKVFRCIECRRTMTECKWFDTNDWKACITCTELDSLCVYQSFVNDEPGLLVFPLPLSGRPRRCKVSDVAYWLKEK